jgi:2-polyprenyl-3-methyl-5-hydroxy-6-metoxy-1,4-benzoquinol methylase
MKVFSPQAIQRIEQQWHNRPELPISYATVRDFCEYADVCPEMFAGCYDLKDAQRPWVVRAILSSVPRGSSLVEIGGGQPFVAQALVDLGYKVTVVDPYDGTGNGPVEYEAYLKTYPEVQLVRALFTPDCQFTPGQFDCVYSVSVIEHVPIPHLAGLFEASRKFVRQGGASIHCIDVVTKGWLTQESALSNREILHQQYHLTGQTELMETGVYQELVNRMEDDLETFYLSAHGHNGWRTGLGLTYERFSFRKVASMQLCGKIKG